MRQLLPTRIANTIRLTFCENLFKSITRNRKENRLLPLRIINFDPFTSTGCVQYVYVYVNKSSHQIQKIVCQQLVTRQKIRSGAPQAVGWSNRHLPASPASPLVFSRLDLILPQDQARQDERGRLPRTNLSHFKQNQTHLINQPLFHPITSCPVATGERRSDRCGYTGSSNHRPAHKRLRLYGCFLLTGAEVMFGSHLRV